LVIISILYYENTLLSYEKKIQGKWVTHTNGERIQMEFYDDGKLVMKWVDDEGNNDYYSIGNYAFAGDGRYFRYDIE
jgi:hypothetical protein